MHVDTSLLVASLLVLGAAGAAQAGVQTKSTDARPQSYTLRCWQNGVKIIDEKVVGTLAPPASGTSSTWSVTRNGDGSTLILNIDHGTLCLFRRPR